MSHSCTSNLPLRNYLKGRRSVHLIACAQVAIIIGMLGFTYFSVPLYRIFCAATGYGGTVAEGATVESKLRKRVENPDIPTEECVPCNGALSDCIYIPLAVWEITNAFHCNITHSARQRWGIVSQLISLPPALRLSSLSTCRAAAKRQVTIAFAAEVQPGLKWSFKPAQKAIKIRPGQSTLVFYTAENLSDEHITAVSTYNVAPPQVLSPYPELFDAVCAYAIGVAAAKFCAMDDDLNSFQWSSCLIHTLLIHGGYETTSISVCRWGITSTRSSVSVSKSSTCGHEKLWTCQFSFTSIRNLRQTVA